MKTLEDDWYVIIKACKITVFKILNFFFLMYYNIFMSVLSLNIYI